MPHRKSTEPCRRHRYRGRFHDACEADTWPHYHVKCRRCPFEWWQPVLFVEGILT